MTKNRRFHPVFRACALITAWAMGFTLITPPPPAAATSRFELPVPGSMVSTSNGFIPPMLRGLRVDTERPFAFDFILDTGNADLDQLEVKEEAGKLIRYFLASLTIPEDDLWVNLSPYEGDRIIPAEFGVTEMGRDVLAQDYILKQLTASLMYPEEDLGKEFWDKVYARAQQLYGTTDISVNTFIKVWIVPDKALVYEHEDVAYVLESNFKVMLEKDYVAMRSNLRKKELGTDQLGEIEVQELNEVSSEVIRDVVIPEIQKEVNTGENFARLRQIYQSLVLAKWYKERLKSSILNRAYADRKKVNGVDLSDKNAKEKIYRQYLEAFKLGVFDYIREEYDAITQEIIPRKYFSGGLELRVPLEITTDAARLADTNPVGKLSWIQGVYRQPRSSPKSVNEFIRNQFREGNVTVGEPLLLEDGTTRKTYYVDDLLSAMGQLGHIGFVEKDEEGRPIAGGQEVVFLDTKYADDATLRRHEAYKVRRWTEKRDSLGLSPEQMRGWLKDNLAEATQFLQSVDRDAARSFPVEPLYTAAEIRGELPTNEQIAATYAQAGDFQDLNLAAGRWGRRDPRTQAMLPNNPVLRATDEGETFDDILLKEMSEQRGVPVADLEADFRRTVTMMEERLRHSGFITPDTDVSAAKMHEIYGRLVAAFRTKTDQEPGEFAVVDANSVNAFVIRNRSDVYFYKGLYETFAEVARQLGRPLTEDVIAFIIAHEMGHVLQHTSYQGLNLKDLYDNASPYLIQMIKNAEYDADMQALELMDRAGFSVFGAIDAMSFLEYISRSSQPEEVLSSHPYVSLRKNRLIQIIHDQETTVFTNVKALRLPMPSAERLASRDTDFRLVMDASVEDLLALTADAQSLEEIDEALSMVATRRGMDAVKSAAANERMRTAFMRHMFMQAGLTAIERQTSSFLLGYGDKVNFQNMVRAAAIAAFGNARNVDDILQEEPLEGVEQEQDAAIAEILARTDERLAGQRQVRDKDRRARQLIRALGIAFGRAAGQLNARTFEDFLLPRSEVEDIIGLFKEADEEITDQIIIDALREPRRLISAYFYADTIGQDTSREIRVPTTNVRVRLQQRSNDLYLPNPRHRDTESEADRRDLQEVLLTQFLLGRTNAPVGQPSNFTWRRFGGVESMLTPTQDELRQMFDAYFNLLSRDYPPDIGAELAADRVYSFTGSSIQRQDFVRAAREGEGSLASLARVVSEAQERGDSVEDIRLAVELHGMTQFVRRAWQENPDRFGDIDLEQTLAQIATEGLRPGSQIYNDLSGILAGMQAVYESQPVRPGSASEIFQRETGLNMRTLPNKVDSFTTLKQLPDWAMSAYLVREGYTARRLITQALEQGLNVSEIFDFMRSRLTFADRQSLFNNVFITSSGATANTQAFLDFLRNEYNNNGTDVALWFMSMFSTQDALKNIVTFAGKALTEKAGEAPDAATATALKEMAISLLEFAFTQASPTFQPAADAVDAYLKLIGERIDAQGMTGAQRTAAVHAALMKVSPAAALDLKISRSRRYEEGAPADYRAETTGRLPEFDEDQRVASLPSSLDLHRFGWNAADEDSAGGLFVSELADMSVPQLRALLTNRVNYLATQASVEYRQEQFTVNGSDDFFANLLSALLIKKLGSPQWDTSGSQIERLDELLPTKVTYVRSEDSDEIRISNIDMSLQIDQQTVNALPFETVAQNFVGTAIPTRTFDKVWLEYVKANNLQSRFPEFVALLQNPNVGVDKSNPLGEYLRAARGGQKVSYRQVIKKFFLGSSAFSELFNAYVKEEGEGYLYGTYRPLAERLEWIETVLPGRSILKDGILDLWETDVFPEIIGGMDILAQAAKKANAGDGDLWTLLGEIDDDVGRLQRLNSELSVSPDRIGRLLDFYTTIIPQVFSPQKISRYGATAYLLWRQLPQSAELGLDGQLEALTKFMPEPSVLRDELLTTVVSRYIRRLDQADDVAGLLYVNNLLARNRDLRSEDFVSETVQHLFGGAKAADKRDVLLWVVGVQEKPPFVTETEDRYRIDFTSLPDDVKLLPGTIRNRFIEGFMLGDNGVLDPRTAEDREVMRDLLNQLFVTVFPAGVEGITENGRQALARVFRVAMEAYPAYKRVSIIKALADLGFRTDFELTSLGERLAVLLGVMGPVGIKVAQFLSENDTLIPDSGLRSSLGNLRHQAPEVPKISAISVLQNEIPFAATLVQEIGDPRGIASIKQVNSGRWIDLDAVAGELTFRGTAAEAADIRAVRERFSNREISFAEFAGYILRRADAAGLDFTDATVPVVYKIRRPNMNATLDSDYDALDAVAGDLQGQSFRGETITSVDELVATVKEWVELEKDFRNEAAFHELISDLDYSWAQTFADEADVTIAHPKVYFATESVIVEEEVPGVPLLSLSEQQTPVSLQDVLAAGYTMPAAQEVLNRLQEESPRRASILLSLKRAGYREGDLNDLTAEIESYDYDRVRSLLRKMLLHQIFVDGIFHADLHQGNVLLTPDGRLSMIDRGNVGRLNASQIEGVRTLLKGLSLRQSDLIKEGIDRIYLSTEHPDGRTAGFAAITRDQIQEILDEGYDMKMTMSVIGTRTVQGTARTQAEKDFSSFLKAFTQAIWLFPTDFANGVGTLQDIAEYVGMDENEVVASAEEQAKYFVAADTTAPVTARDSDLMQVAREIMSEKLATTRNPFTRLMLRGVVFPLIRRSLRRAEGNPTELAGRMIGLVRSMGPQVLRDNLETLAQLRNFELLDAVGELLNVPFAENVMTTYLQTSLRARGFGPRSVSLAMPILQGLMKTGRPVTQIYLDVGGEWLDGGGRRLIARMAPRITLGEAIRLLSQAFPQDFAAAREQFDQLAQTTSPRLTPAQLRIQAAEDIPDIQPADSDDTTDRTGLIANAVAAGDRAVLPGQEEVGGIDLNPNLLELQIEGDRLELNIPVDTDGLEPVQIEGLMPVIINVTPITNLPLILGAAEAEAELYASAN